MGGSVCESSGVYFCDDGSADARIFLVRAGGWASASTRGAAIASREQGERKNSARFRRWCRGVGKQHFAFCTDLSNGFAVRDACGLGPCVRVSDISGLARANLWRAGATIRKHHICDRQPGWGHSAVACRSYFDSLWRATYRPYSSYRRVRRDVLGEWIFSRA